MTLRPSQRQLVDPDARAVTSATSENVWLIIVNFSCEIRARTSSHLFGATPSMLHDHAQCCSAN